MSNSRLLPAALLVVLPLVGCASGQHDVTSREHASPYLADAHVGPVQVRNVVIAPASGAGASSSTTASGGGPQAYLSMVVLSNTSDQLTNATLSGGGTVTPTDPTTQLSVGPAHVLTIVNPELGTTGPALAVTGLPVPPVVGTAVQVTLSFQTAGQVTLWVPVRDVATA